MFDPTDKLNAASIRDNAEVHYCPALFGTEGQRVTIYRLDRQNDYRHYRMTSASAARIHRLLEGRYWNSKVDTLLGYCRYSTD